MPTKRQAKKTETQGKKRKSGRQGEGGGQPPKYANAKALETIALKYFSKCSKTRELPSKAGLLYHLDISRETYSQYRKKYPDTISKFNKYIEMHWVGRLAGNAATGAIFYLKNAFKEDYKDKQETDITSKGEQVVIYVPKRD